MAIYTVLAPGSAEAEPDPMAVVFVKEGFCWPALFVPLLWLIFRRLWLALVGWIVIVLAIAALGRAMGPTFAVPTFVLFRFLFALEANELRRWTLRRKGYRLAAIVEGRGLEEAEIRYFAGREAVAEGGQPSPPSAGATPPPPAPPAPPKLGPIAPSAEAGDVIGLFPAPGARA